MDCPSCTSSLGRVATKTGFRILAAFDFDSTIVNACSDTYVLQLTPNDHPLPEDVSQLYSSRGFTRYMSAVFGHLHQVCHVTPDELLDCVAGIPFVDGMRELIECLSSTVMELGESPRQAVEIEKIIISDGNYVLIDHILQKAGLRHAFSRIFTNPAEFDADGCLTLRPYHHQDWCSLSTENLCKGRILDHYRSSQFPADFDMVIYVGDGSNDVCPAQRLQDHDIVFARRGYKLAKAIEAENSPVTARVVQWDTGFDILNAVNDELVRRACPA